MLERKDVLVSVLTTSKSCRAIFHHLERKALAKVRSGTGSIFNITKHCFYSDAWGPNVNMHGVKYTVEESEYTQQ